VRRVAAHQLREEVEAVSVDVAARRREVDDRRPAPAAWARRTVTEHLTEHVAADDVPISEYLRLQAHLHIDLCEGDGPAASARVEAAWPAFQRSLLARFRQLRIEFTILRGRAALAMAATTDVEAICELPVAMGAPGRGDDRREGLPAVYFATDAPGNRGRARAGAHRRAGRGRAR
jgi:hypothetical protein